MRANSAAYLELFNGGDGSGFDDLIDDEGFPKVSNRFACEAEAVIEAIDRASNPLYDELIAIETSSDATACMNAFAEPDTGEPDDGLQGC